MLEVTGTRSAFDITLADVDTVLVKRDKFSRLRVGPILEIRLATKPVTLENRDRSVMVRVCSATAPANPAPTAASKALPPFCNISTAAPLTSGCPVATIALLNFFIARILGEVL